VWPLGRPTVRKRALWAALWRRPEAIVWEEHHAEVQVALYVCAVMAADHPKATASDRKAALSYMDDLGLSEGGRTKNRWVIDSAEPARETKPTDDPDRLSAKARLTSIQGGAA